MQVRCRECDQLKPESEVQLGVCDGCFKYGSAKTSPSSGAPRPVAPAAASHIIITTSIDVPRRAIESVVSIVSAEVAIGVNVLRDIANSWRDVFGGRSTSSQNALREARAACLEALKREANTVGADAVIAVSLNYNELSAGGSGGGILFVAANGTAVKLAEPART